MLKVGVIGVGSISEFHINPYLANERTELVAFCDSNESRLMEKGERLMRLVFAHGTIHMPKLRLLHWKRESMCWWKNL